LVDSESRESDAVTSLLAASDGWRAEATTLTTRSRAST
jgi:hypothetical protein